MIGHILIVHFNPGFLNPLAEALRVRGYDVLTLASVALAWDSILSLDSLTALITKVRFPKGGLDGVALARHARRIHPGARIFFSAGPELARRIDGVGTLLPTPMRPRDLANIVTNALADGAFKTDDV
jgi:DNA-binding response OmpR family regulator